MRGGTKATAIGVIARCANRPQGRQCSVQQLHRSTAAPRNSGRRDRCAPRGWQLSSSLCSDEARQPRRCRHTPWSCCRPRPDARCTQASRVSRCRPPGEATGCRLRGARRPPPPPTARGAPSSSVRSCGRRSGPRTHQVSPTARHPVPPTQTAPSYRQAARTCRRGVRGAACHRRRRRPRCSPRPAAARTGGTSGRVRTGRRASPRRSPAAGPPPCGRGPRASDRATRAAEGSRSPPSCRPSNRCARGTGRRQ
mmetsp:Transcript_39287/g.117453  ORF Transcript_39287/g.117453 Transcript_39287/m.117453 type:complete len:253 (-) Transcript_39287:531-1289(-)